MTLSNVVIRDTRPDVSDGSYGRGINVTGGAEVDAVRLIVAANHEIGIGVFGTRSAARLRDTVVRDTRRSTPGGAGRGINVEDGARLEATRLLVVGSHDAGILGGADGASLVLTDTVVRDTLTTESSVTVTSGILLHGRASMVATRLLVANNHDIGIAVESEGSAVTLTDAVIRDTHHREGTDGVGGLLVQGGSVDATRLLIVRSHTMGVSAFIGGAIALTDTAVRDTAPPTDDGTLSRGINIQGPVQFNGNRVVIEGAKLGLVALSSAMGTIRDVSITRIAPPRICGTATCPDERGGHGVVVAGAALDMTAFEVRDAAICGVFLSPELETTDSSSLDLESGDISGSEIGACVQVSGYDLDRLTHRVEYRDNGTNLDTTTLPVPAPVIEHVSGR